LHQNVGLGVRDLPHIPDPPHPGESSTDLHWRALMERVAAMRVPSPVHVAREDWVSLKQSQFDVMKVTTCSLN
jgi:hypothetical protein